MTLHGTWKKAILVPPLLFALWLLQDDESSRGGDGRNQHLALSTALRRHPPSLRVFRSLLEIDLVLWGVAASLFIWSYTVGTKAVGHLLFQSADNGSTTGGRGKEGHSGRYEPVLTVEADELWADQDVKKEEATKSFQYESDDDEDAPDEVLLEEVLELPLPPTAASVAGAALDLLLLTLVSLFLFTLSSAEGGRYVDGMAKIETFRFVAIFAAPVFPLLLVFGVAMFVVLPWRKRREFWMVILYTVGAPCYDVTFRDGFIGDILTSSVRPLQDIAFTVFYLVSGLQGWWHQSYDLDHADLPLETNWLLHTWVLPMCMISPLWWRFLQNLRQSYEAKKRWPYLGNAFKYFIAAEVAMYGIFYPLQKQSVLWLASFALATLYQVWWDVFMDWELIEVNRSGIHLRSTRVYGHRWMYWAIFAVNFVLRFCWVLSFLPPHYLNRAGVLSRTFEGDLPTILNPMIASAEIFRRTLWGLLRLELEAIKVARTDGRLKGRWIDAQDHETDDNVVELQRMAVSQGLQPREPLELMRSGVWLSSEMSTLSDLQILGELCLWATAFASLGLVAAAHRMTL